MRECDLKLSIKVKKNIIVLHNNLEVIVTIGKKAFKYPRTHPMIEIWGSDQGSGIVGLGFMQWAWDKIFISSHLTC